MQRLLPPASGANLTNLLVLSREHVSGVTYAARMLPASLAAIVVTAAVLLLLFRRSLRGAAGPSGDRPPPVRVGVGLVASVAAALVVLLARQPALPVFAIGLAAAPASHVRGRLERAQLRRAVDVPLLLSLFLLAVALGTLARAWPELDRLVATASAPVTTLIAALASLAVNNLPAAGLLTAHAPAHPRALLIGLNVGPNLAVTGALSALLWLQVARAAGRRPSPAKYTLVGVASAPLAMAAALLALALVGQHGL